MIPNVMFDDTWLFKDSTDGFDGIGLLEFIFYLRVKYYL